MVRSTARLAARCAAAAALAAAAAELAAAARPQPPWEYSYDSFPAAWFGANSTGWETEAQLEQLGRYHMVAFGFFDLLTKNNYTHEGAALIEQSRIVKRRHPNVTVGIYIDNLRFEPFYDGMKVAVDDPQYRDMFLLNKSSPTHAPLESETYCVQMVPKIGARDPRCLAPFWNWFNETAVDFFLDKVLAPIVAQPGYDVVFFDGADGFIRGARFPGSWQHASNVPAGTTHADAVQVLIRLHARMAELCLKNGKYAILSEHLQDTGNFSASTDEGPIVDGLVDAPMMRYYEDFLRGPTWLGDSQEGYVQTIIAEAQNKTLSLPEVIHYVTCGADRSCPDPNSLKGTAAVAAFLVARGEYSYFMASTGWYDANFKWQPEYDIDYGKPLEDARYDGASGVFTRQYTKCSVTLDCADPHACKGKIVMK